MDRFDELEGEIKHIREMLKEKNRSYAKERDPWSNLRLCEEMGIPAWTGVIVRLGDKQCRLMQFVAKREKIMADEGVIDAFRDMIGYALIGIILYRESLKD